MIKQNLRLIVAVLVVLRKANSVGAFKFKGVQRIAKATYKNDKVRVL